MGLLAGDLTGKAIVPIIDNNGRYETELFGVHRSARSDQELAELERDIADVGYYSFVTSSDEAARMSGDESARDELLARLMGERVQSWLELATERLGGEDVPLVLIPVVLLAVKDTQTEGAAAWLARLCDANTVVCALQNGVEQVERVGRFCPESTVVPAAVWFSAETHPAGHIRLRTAARLTLPDDPAAKRLAETLRSPRLSIECSADFATEAWRKLLTNAVAGLMVLTGRKPGMFRRDDVARLAADYLAECLAVARAEGANLDDAAIGEIIGLFVGLPEDVTTSILTDREQGRPMEWDVRNGVITRKAAEHGLTFPIGLQ